MRFLVHLNLPAQTQQLFVRGERRTPNLDNKRHSCSDIGNVPLRETLTRHVLDALVVHPQFMLNLR